jgi:hypothetical protein
MVETTHSGAQTGTITADVESEQFRAVVAELANALLDEFYADVPNANAYGAGYDASGERRSTWYLGREHGADGAENEDVGFDFLYRKFVDTTSDGRPEEENEYVFGRYGWMNSSELLDERGRLRQLFEDAVSEGYLDEEDLEQFDDTANESQQALREWREQFSLADVAELFHEEDEETLRDLLAHGDEEGRVVWSLLNSKDADGEVMSNPLETPVISEEHALMLVRAERTYVEDGESKSYPYAAVVGYDDTPERFFVHRLESDPEIRDPNTEWSVEKIKSKMGFDAHLWEVETENLPKDNVVRVQGDLAVIRHDYEEVLQEYVEEELEDTCDEIAAEYAGEFFEHHPQYEEHEAVHASAFEHGYSFRVNDRAVDGTDELKELQDALDIDEETVRARMRDDWKQLTAKRRRTLIDEILSERLVEWSLQQDDTTLAELSEEVEAKARASFTDTAQQVNDVHGNHTVILGSVCEHPDPMFGDDDTLAGYVVPEGEKATGYVIHDEHNNQELTLAPGVYSFRFLSGYEDQWWMN